MQVGDCVLTVRTCCVSLTAWVTVGANAIAGTLLCGSGSVP
jgi:hypothetical protein